MEKKDKNKKIISLSIVLFIVMLLVSGGSYAYWTWITNTSERTNVALTITAPDMTATLTGYTQTVTNLAPVSSCTDSTYAIKKQLTLTYENLSTNAGTIKGTLSIENFVSPNGTPDSDDLSHLHYAVTKSGDSCTTDVIRGGYGTFTGTSGNLFTDITLKGAIPAGTEETSSTYYLWVWLDADYTHQNVGSGVTNDPMQNISFNLVWTGTLLNDGAEPEQPVLAEGMIPVTIANNGTVTTIAEYDLDWYDYSNKEWANVVLVDSDSRSTYQGTTGKTVNQNDILAYYTWIPRYSYKIPNMTCGELNNPTAENNPDCYSYTLSPDDKDLFIEYWYNNEGSWLQEGYGITYTMEQATEDVETMLNTGSVYMEEDSTYFFTEVLSWYNDENDPDITYESTLVSTRTTTGPRTIDISFESTESSTLTGDAVSTYRTHPAFVFGGETTAGIWVGKFETSTDSTSTCYTTSNSTNCNNTNQSPRILPNVYSLRYQYIGNQFTTSQKFSASGNIYGISNINTDAHMMKNNEWGAVAYLSHSLYGINTEIRLNNNSNYTTGCGAAEENGAETTECQIAYGGATSYPQSTTGNITGVFDMSGGSWEYVMGNYNNTAHSTYFPTLPDSKYYDVYLSTQFTGDYSTNMSLCTLETCGGHALSETAGWYNDDALFVDSDSPWFIRGGDYSFGAFAGAFSVLDAYGVAANSNSSWRSVLVVG